MFSSLLVSVLMPAFNAEQYIGQAIDSILCQSFNQFEFIIIDDGSTDNTCAIAKSYASQDRRIKFYQNSNNIGLVETLNAGVSLSQCEFVARMDADDIADISRLKTQYDYMCANPDITLCSTSFIVLETKARARLPESHEKITARMLYQCCVCHPSAMFRKDNLLRIGGGYQHNTPNAEDYDLWERLISKGARFAGLPQYLLTYRAHPSIKRDEYFKKQQASSDNIRIRQIYALGIEPTASDLDAHFALAAPDKPCNASILVRAYFWSIRVLLASMKSKRFSFPELASETLLRLANLTFVTIKYKIFCLK